jgi:hypothetical protein
MRTKRLRTGILSMVCFLPISTTVVADPQMPAGPPTQSIASDQLGDQPGSIAKEFDAIKDLAKKLDQRIRRVELMLEYECALQTRSEALRSWQDLRKKRETLADFEKRDDQLRTKYYEARTETNRIAKRLNELYK